MALALSASIRDQITALLADRISLLAFQDWLVGATWDVEQHADPQAAELAYGAKLALADLSRDDITQSEFRDRMSELVDAPILRP